jgi:hypothetical protein
MRYAGLTDEPERRKREHSNPRDFGVMQQFTCDVSESAPSVSRRNEARGSTLRSDNGKVECWHRNMRKIPAAKGGNMAIPFQCEVNS